jgi:hypothetical protein
MKRFLLFLLFYLVVLQGGRVQAETVNVATAGTLSAALTSAGINTGTVTSLTITRSLNSYDINFLRKIITATGMLEKKLVKGGLPKDIKNN